jgi:uncharacterized protein YbjQ (UPF0145 family)
MKFGCVRVRAMKIHRQRRFAAPAVARSRNSPQLEMSHSNRHVSKTRQCKSAKEVPVNKSIHLLVVVIGIWLTGCTPYQATLTNEERSYPATVPEKVQIFLQGETTPTATEIGHIVVAEKSVKEGIEFLQRKAAETGADAVVNVEIQIQTRVIFIIVIPIPIHTYLVSGTAIKITK